MPRKREVGPDATTSLIVNAVDNAFISVVTVIVRLYLETVGDEVTQLDRCRKGLETMIRRREKLLKAVKK